MRERKVAWMLLRNASVLSLEDGVLTLRFPRDGDLKGFSVSGHDAILKQVLANGFGLTVMIKGVVGGDAPAAGSGPGRAPAGRAAPAARQAPAPAPARTPAPAGPPPPAYQDEDDGYDGGPPPDLPPEDDEMPPDEPPARRQEPAELTGMDLIQRELGGQVIGEFED